MSLGSFAYCLQVTVFAHTCGQSLLPNASLQPRPLSPLSRPGHVARAQPGTTPGWMSGQELQNPGCGGGRGGGGTSFSAGPWGRAVNGHVFLRFRRGWKGLGFGKQALRADPTASALHLLSPPLAGSCGRCNTPRLHFPACLAHPAQDFRLLGLLGVVVQAFSGLGGREQREGRGNGSVWGRTTYGKLAPVPSPFLSLI